MLKFKNTKQQQKLNKKVLFNRDFICSDPFLGPEKRAYITPYIQFIFVGIIEPNGAGVGFAVVWVDGDPVAGARLRQRPKANEAKKN